MKLYLVRHGESEHNAKNAYQPGDSKLSEKGLEQANFLAHRFEGIPIDIIFSSPFERARQTAEAIGKAVGKEVMYQDLLRETKKPSEVVGKEENDPEAVAILKKIGSHADDPAWHHSDEENFTELKNRGKEFLAFIQSEQEESVLCVTHGTFLRMVICLMLQKDPDAVFFKNFWGFFRTRNTGITLCEYENGKWCLLTWNDHAHLG